MNRRDFSAQLAVTGLGAAASSLFVVAGPAAAQGAPAEGRQFARIDPPVPPVTPGKIEVIEFFSYACPHCSAFEPAGEAWAKKVPADVAFLRVPVPFLQNFENLMRTYYTLESMGLVDTMQRKVFTAIHVDHGLRPGSAAGGGATFPGGRSGRRRAACRTPAGPRRTPRPRRG